MKAEFKRTRTADGLPLTFGKMYDVLDVKAGKKPWQLKEIKVKNDLGQERWYSANKFKLFAEAAAYLKEQTAAGAGQNAGRSATPDGKQIYIGIDVAGGTDMTVCGKSLEMTDIERADAAAGYTARAALEIGEAAAAGIAEGFGLNNEKARKAAAGIADGIGLNYGA